MSFSSKPTRPDSKDTAKLRKEYEDKARQFREASDPASKAKLKDDKQKAFDRVVQQMNGERASDLQDHHRILAKLGKFKTDEQVAKEKAEADAKTPNNRPAIGKA